MEPEADEVKAGAPEWMVTFADLMSLLLTFFVLLLSFSNMEIVKFRVMAGSVKNALGLKSELALSDIPMGSELLPALSPKEGEGESTKREPIEDASATQETVVKMRKMIEQLELEDQAQVLVREDGVALRVEGDLFFDTAKTGLKPGAKQILDAVRELADTSPGRLAVEGHTDNVPIKNPRFPSNWELSAARAGTAVRYLTARGLPAARVRAVGYADTIAIDTNTTVDGRARNRRVEFFFETAAVAPAEGAPSSGGDS